MSEEDRENIGGALGLGLGALGALWFVAWLFHLGPDIDKAWWSLPYYLTAVGAAFVFWAAIAVSIYFAVQRFPLSAGEKHGG